MLTALFNACRKEKVPVLTGETPSENCNDCTPVPPGNPGVFDQYVLDSIHFTSPQFNPHDNNEIVFMHWTSGVQKLYKYNMLTEQRTLLFEGNFSGSNMSWGAEDWILFQLMDYQIWKIKSDGTQLTQVTSNGAWFHPEWNLSGTEFTAYQGYVDGNFFYPGKILDGAGNIVDSFYLTPIVGDWNHALGYYGCVNTDKISIIDPHTGEFVSQFQSNMANYRSFNWISDNEALITKVDGIFKYHIFSNSFTKLKCSCGSKIYTGGTVNSNKTKIIYSRDELSRLDGSTILAKSNLVIMDIDGSNEVEIEIPL